MWKHIKRILHELAGNPWYEYDDPRYWAQVEARRNSETFDPTFTRQC